MSNVYITKAAKFFPNEPISNDEMEEYLGLINDKVSKSKRIILRNNGIKRRFYALDKSGVATHTNSQMTALAVRALFENNDKGLKDLDLLACGTSTPDQMMPSHGVMVHGWLPDTNAIEVVSPSGVCCAGMHAFKYAFMSIKLGDAKTAVATGSERLSRVLRGDVFEEESKKLEALEGNGYVGFEKDFLRWMLSDGAGAFLLSNEKNENDINLRVEWLEGVSYAHEIKPCMYMASEKMEDGNIKSYMDYSPQEMIEGSILSIKQDVKLLGEYIVPLGFDKLKLILERRGMTVDEIDYFLPHMSSEFFRSKISEKLEENGMAIPQERWFTNLSYVGNVGAGSIYMMVEELLYSGKLKKGQTILLAVPESSRFSYMFGLLTVC
ncbi:MAG: 3-oxoacyl-(acyl-carrier-protein) synthase [Cytophagaceae bacterium]|jgi:3-oxoacyl-[acyl-carrier-protein] synthase-3|nr:3-oxoacyl-(acyl-carrier-protein) synthase [Cytophagaceae bacterium]